MHGIYNYMPETNHVSKAWCCSCSVLATCAKSNAIFHVEYFVPIH